MTPDDIDHTDIRRANYALIAAIADDNTDDVAAHPRPRLDR